MKKIKYSVYTLTSFEPIYDFVYESIQSAAKEISEKEGYEIKITRADEYVETKINKVEEIKSRIAEADFLIIDFSERTENIMWEFGYAQCLEKRIIPLDHSGLDSPFNISETDKIIYEPSRVGLNNLEEMLAQVMSSTIKTINSDQEALFFDEDIQRYFGKIEAYLKSVSRRTIRHKLVAHELERVSKRISAIDSHSFDFRNRKPYPEITNYYCDYIQQSGDKVSSFDAISCCDFWVTISNGNRNDKYLSANKKAIEKGIKISRVFVVSPTKYNKVNGQYSHLMSKVLKEHREWVRDYGIEKVDVRILLVGVDEEYSDEEQYYHANNGLLRNDTECLLFHPKYNEGDGFKYMERTDIWYSKITDKKEEVTEAIRNYKLVHDRATPILDFDFAQI